MIKNLKHFTFAVLGFILLMCTNIIFIFNSKFIFKYFAIQNELSQKVSIPTQEIFQDYERIIQYVRNPLVYNLNFDNFTLSSNGALHFFEVKVIFIYICTIVFLISLFFITYIIYRRFFYEKTLLRTKMRNNLQLCSKYLNRIVLVFIFSITSFMIIDFDKAFTFMHNIFFDNDYWIFNSTTDSIINILPPNFFMLCAIIIISMLVIELIIVNIYTKKDVGV